jgi:capsular polysaccharide biosynthesis protein
VHESDEIEPPDGPMTAEEAARAAALSPNAIERIDAAILSHAKQLERKVAMIVALAMDDVPLAGVPDLFYASRVKALVAKGALLAEGNLDYMRYSEVRLPEAS